MTADRLQHTQIEYVTLKTRTPAWVSSRRSHACMRAHVVSNNEDKLAEKLFLAAKYASCPVLIPYTTCARVTQGPHLRSSDGRRNCSMVLPLLPCMHAVVVVAIWGLRKSCIESCMWHATLALPVPHHPMPNIRLVARSVARGSNIFFQIMVTFLSHISNACHSLSGVAERLQYTMLPPQLSMPH